MALSSFNTVVMVKSQVALVVKNPPANGGEARDTGSLSQEDPLEEGVATQSSILVWRIPMDRGA